MKNFLIVLVLLATFNTGCAGMDEFTRLNNLGAEHIHKGEYDLAIEYLQKALDIAYKEHSREDKYVTASLSNLGVAWSSKGEYDKAIEYHQKVLDLKLKTLEPDNPDLAVNWNNLGEAWKKKGHLDKAIEYHEKSLALALKTQTTNPTNVARSWNNLASVFMKQGNPDKAIKYHEKVMALGESRKLDDRLYAKTWANLCYAWILKEQYGKALGSCEKAKSLFQKLNYPIYIQDMEKRIELIKNLMVGL